MCGIVGATSRRDVMPILMAGLNRLEYRGYDSAGIAVQDVGDSKIKRVRMSGRVQELELALASAPLEGHSGIAHTRWATHGEPSETNAHPHMSGETIALVHNGIIENYESLRGELVEDGYAIQSETDSEVVAHLIHKEIQQSGDLFQAVKATVRRLEGAYAIGVVSALEAGRIVGARAGCPLVVGVGIKEHFLASDVLALRPVTDQFVILEEGDVVSLQADEMIVCGRKGAKVNRSVVQVDSDLGKIDKGPFRHHMEKEIHEQPAIIQKIVDAKTGRDQVLEQAFGIRASKILDETQAVSIVGCGTSFYAALIAKYWIEDLAKISCHAEIASEFRYRQAVASPGTLFVTLSQSGESADTLSALRLAKEREYAHNLTIGNVPTSTLFRESELTIDLNAGPEVSVCSTKTFTACLVNLLLWTLLLARRKNEGKVDEELLVHALRELPEVAKDVLSLGIHARRVAKEFVNVRHALFLGRGPQYPLALEGALKLKEISYIHAEGYPAGELKHGPLALVDEDMPVVAVAPSDELLEKLQSNLQEVRARGGRLYVFADVDAEIDSLEGITVIRVPKTHPVLASILYAIPLQMLAYHVAMLKGTDIDHPRNLAKSVTVE